MSGPKIGTLKDNKRQLTDDERAKVMEAKAVWHHGPNGEETPAVWKAVVNGEEWFVTNTHRAYQAKKSLDGAINAFHDFIKSTASCPQCRVRTAWRSPMISPTIGEKITIPDMGEWIQIERIKKFPRQSRWIALVTTSEGKRKWVDSRKIAGWVPFPHEDDRPVKQLPQGDGLAWAEDWESSGESVMRKARRWVDLNCDRLRRVTIAGSFRDPLYFGGNISNLRVPLFTTPDMSGAEWYASEKQGRLYEIKFTGSKIGLDSDLENAVRETGAKSQDIVEDSGGNNFLDFVYVPKVRENLKQKGISAIWSWDELDRGEIPVLAITDGAALSIVREVPQEEVNKEKDLEFPRDFPQGLPINFNRAMFPDKTPAPQESGYCIWDGSKWVIVEGYKPPNYDDYDDSAPPLSHWHQARRWVDLNCKIAGVNPDDNLCVTTPLCRESLACS